MGRLHGIGARISVAMFAMGVITLAAIGVGFAIFQQVSGQVHGVNDERIPEINQTEKLIAATSALNGSLNRILATRDADTLGDIQALVARQADDALQVLNGMDSNAGALRSALDQVEGALDDLITARRAAIGARAEIAAVVDDIEQREVDISNALETLVDGSYFDLAIGGEDAIASVEQVLTQLTNRDFLRLRVAQAVRSEVNLLTGMLAAMRQTGDPALLSIFRDLATGASARLDAALGELATSGRRWGHGRRAGVRRRRLVGGADGARGDFRGVVGTAGDRQHVVQPAG